MRHDNESETTNSLQFYHSIQTSKKHYWLKMARSIVVFCPFNAGYSSGIAHGFSDVRLASIQRSVIWVGCLP